MALDDGDVGRSPGDDELGDDEPTRPLLPPDDRLWRHPSELFSSVPATSPPLGLGRGAGERQWGLVVSAGVVGALIATGIVLASGHLGSSKVRGVAASAAVTLGTKAPHGSGGAAGAASSGTPGSTAPTVAVGDSLHALAARLAPSMVALEITSASGKRRGTGLIYRSDGTVVTTDRLVRGSTSITAVSSTGQEESAALVGSDPDNDVAVMRVGGTGLVPAPFFPAASLPSLAPGQLTTAVSTGDGNGDRPQVYVGTVQSMNRHVALGDGPPLLGAIETDAPLSTNVDGGALLDSAGRVVGLVAGDTGSGTATRSLAVPVAAVESSANQILVTGRATHSWLGIDGSNLSAGKARSLGVAGGVDVQEVDPHSPAAAAGMTRGEVIESINGSPVPSLLDLQADLHGMAPGTQVSIAGELRGHPVDVTLHLAASSS